MEVHITVLEDTPLNGPPQVDFAPMLPLQTIHNLPVIRFIPVIQVMALSMVPWQHIILLVIKEPS